MISERAKDSPDVIPFPPIVFLGALGAGLFLNWLVPLQSFSMESLHITGGILCFIGTALGMWGIRTMHLAGTNVRPSRPVTALVTAGPFRYSRNPLYIASTVIYLGITVSIGEIWPLATLVPALVLVHWKIVRREEQFLENRFGEAYRAYKAHVHRWI